MGNRTQRISDARQEQMVELYAQGVSRIEIAARMGSTSKTVTQVLQARGVALRPYFIRKVPSADVPRIAARYEAGERISSIANAYGCTELIIRRILDRHGVVRRDDRGRTRHFTEAEYAAMAEMAAAGKSQNQIAKALDSARDTIQGAMAQRGIAPARTGAATGAQHGAWKGGRRLHPEGYVQRKVDRRGPYGSMSDRHGYAFEHRLAMALHLGRPLEQHETVHHINGIRTDNRIENLQLRRGKHGSGQCYRCLDCGSTNVVAVHLDDHPEAEA